MDITQVWVSGIEQTEWHLILDSAPPNAADLDPEESIVSYGVTFDVTADGTADYVVGISNEAPVAGEFRAWLTDLATGKTQDHVGPPYGLPFDFVHPDELAGYTGLPFVQFTFPRLAPEGIDHKTRFYAWASVIEGGEIVAWDYAPDVGWLSTSGETSDSS